MFVCSNHLTVSNHLSKFVFHNKQLMNDMFNESDFIKITPQYKILLFVKYKMHLNGYTII